MNEELIDFKKTKEKLISFVENKDNSVMVLATSDGNVISARSVLIINDDLDIYFFTWKHSRKCVQIAQNNKVSICKEKVEIEGIAEILGLMTSGKNNTILELIRRKYPGAADRWEDKPNMVIVKVKPFFACVDGYYINDDAYLEYIDFRKDRAYRVKWGYY